MSGWDLTAYYSILLLLLAVNADEGVCSLCYGLFLGGKRKGFLRICVGGSWGHDSRNYICCILAITGFFSVAIWKTRMNAMTRSKLKVLISNNIMAKKV